MAPRQLQSCAQRQIEVVAARRRDCAWLEREGAAAPARFDSAAGPPSAEAAAAAGVAMGG